MSSQTKQKQTKLADFIASARAAGADVSLSLVPNGKKSLSQKVQDLETAAIESNALAGELLATCFVNLSRGTMKTADDKWFLEYLRNRQKEHRRLARVLNNGGRKA